MIAKRIQADLFRQGFFSGAPETFIDGDFGGNTEAALKMLQHARLLPETGSVDLASWQQLCADPIPTLFERCIALTAEFEGHGFTLIQGNFDGAGLTWGIIGFTLSNREIQGILKETDDTVPGTLDRVMGPLASQWRSITAKPLAEQIAWAESISAGPQRTGVPPDWKAAFARLGEESIVRRLQLQRAYDNYFVPAADTAKRLGISSELGIALCFDIHVQNGKSRIKAVNELAGKPSQPIELEQRKALANAVADYASATWREDVRMRKLAIATGEGLVHGRAYRLANWGLTEAAAA